MQILLYLCALFFNLYKYADFTTYRRILPFDGSRFAYSGQATDVLAAVQQGVGEAGLAEFADRAADFCVYRCNPDDTSEDQHRKPAFADLYHGSAHARYVVARILEYNLVFDIGW